MATVFTTGTAGFIMSHCADKLLANGHSVIGLDSLDGGSMANVPDKVCFYRGDIRNEELVNNIFQHHSPDFVIHGAAMAAENLSHNCRIHTYSNNLVGECVIRNAAVNHGVQCMVSLSSIAVMGHQPPPFHDDTQPMPADPYGVCKYAGEMDAMAAREFFGLNYVVVRPHNCVGIRQNLSDRYRNVMSIFIRQALSGEPLSIFGDGSQTRQFSPVSYVAEVIAAAIDTSSAWNQVFNLGSDRVLSVSHLAIKILRRLNLDEDMVTHLPARPEAVHAHMTHDKVRQYFPWIHDTDSLELVLDDMIADARLKLDAPMQKGPRVEVRKNLPPSWSQFV